MDLGGVRVHTGARAEASADAVGALAYTVGRSIVFGRGRYQPASGEGRRLLAHELVHVAQQRDGAVALRRQGNAAANTIDAKAQAIITAAQDTTKPIADRAVAAVKAIIDTYYPNDAAKVRSIVYQAGDPGLTTTSGGTGATSTGEIAVGRYFVENTSTGGLARRVLQVGHELQHIDQHRGGMGGAGKSHVREFLAFKWEALQPAAAGTGRLSHATRVSLIDAALGHYLCLDAATRTAYAQDRTALLTERANHDGKGGNPTTTPPSACPP
jgi:hypothetical protein